MRYSSTAVAVVSTLFPEPQPLLALGVARQKGYRYISVPRLFRLISGRPSSSFGYIDYAGRSRWLFERLEPSISKRSLSAEHSDEHSWRRVRVSGPDLRLAGFR